MILRDQVPKDQLLFEVEIERAIKRKRKTTNTKRETRRH